MKTQTYRPGVKRKNIFRVKGFAVFDPVFGGDGNACASYSGIV